MRRIAVVFNGGTISMKLDQKLKAAVPTLTGEEIMSMVTGIEEHAEVISHNFSSVPSPHMTIDRIMDLQAYVTRLLDDDSIYGIVITHGTDTLEETAYLLDLTIVTDKPIVVTGSMRSGSELGYDGPFNLAQAIVAASSDSSKGRGVLVCMNGELHSASEVTKANSMALNAFRTPLFGPIGIIDNNSVIYYRVASGRQCRSVSKVESRVSLIKACAGMDSSFIRFSVDKGDKGIVIEALGRGNVPPQMVEGIRYALSKGVPVVIVSRCYEGRVYESYGYEGGGKHLRTMGVIFGESLPGQKARIKLMVALSLFNDPGDVREWFEKDLYPHMPA